MNIFGHPYWQLNTDGTVIPTVQTGPTSWDVQPVDITTIPELIAGMAPGMTATQFFEITVKNSPLGGSLITWGLKRGFTDPLPYTFEIYWSETPNGPFHLVDTPVLINTYWAVDPARRLFALDVESYYAIRMVTPSGEYWSYASSAAASWNKKDWLIAREICRKEFLLFRKFTGWDGFLLKRKVWGAACPRCKDFDTTEAADGHCTVCYGTAKDGGYWAPFPTFVYNMGDGPTQFKQLDDNAGLSENTVLPQMRVLGYPHLATNDVFLHYGSGKRFFVRPVHVAAEIKGVPIVYTCELRLAPYTDIIYTYPTAAAVVPPEPEPEPTPESEPTYVEPAAGVIHKIFWYLGEWYLGTSPDQVLYRTTGGYPLANGLSSFTWLTADGQPSGLTVSDVGAGYAVAGGEADGTYYPGGDQMAGLPVFVKQV